MSTPSPEASLIRRDRAWRLAEEERLSPLATRAAASRGRATPEEPCALRTDFERDRDRVLHSKAFRRLKHKTQVFLDPEGDHFVTRLTHVLQVTQVARSLARALGLNESLTEAIALAHDCGHTPFGHTGEEALGPYFADGWHHARQGVRLFAVLEPLNLTWEVRDGIEAHPWSVTPPPATAEGLCVRLADRIAYLSHDTLDAVRAGVLSDEDLPGTALGVLGHPGSEWVDTMVRAAVDHSVAHGAVAMEPTVLEAMAELRAFLFDRVYLAGDNRRRHQEAVATIQRLMDHLLANPQQVPDSYRDDTADLTTQCADYVAGMTDRYALALHDEVVRPRLFAPPPRPGDPT